jgi:hypothetical protein
MYGRMMLVQKMFAEKINKGRPLGRNVIRIEISPSEEESRNWTMDEWVRLADEFIRVSLKYIARLSAWMDFTAAAIRMRSPLASVRLHKASTSRSDNRCRGCCLKAVRRT